MKREEILKNPSVHNIDGEYYVPLAIIDQVTKYSAGGVRRMISDWRLPEERFLTICNLRFIPIDIVEQLDEIKEKRLNISLAKKNYWRNKKKKLNDIKKKVFGWLF